MIALLYDRDESLTGVLPILPPPFHFYSTLLLDTVFGQYIGSSIENGDRRYRAHHRHLLFDALMGEADSPPENGGERPLS